MSGEHTYLLRQQRCNSTGGGPSTPLRGETHSRQVTRCRDYVAFGDIQIIRVRSVDNLADILTKPLARPDFLRLRQYLGLHAGDTRSA